MTIKQILQQPEQVIRMMRRVATRQRSLKEPDLLRLRDAVISSRIRYQKPYLNLTKKLEKKLDTLLRKATEIARGIPPSANTE